MSDWDEDTDYYTILGVGFNATEDEIKKAHRNQAKKYHPDKNRDDPEEATRIFNLVEKAYNTLSDPKKKADYDKQFVKQSGFASFGFGKILDYFNDKDIDEIDEDEDFSDSISGFYQRNERKFISIAKEEGIYDQAPLFGRSNSPWDVVNEFYMYWSNFTTKRRHDENAAGLSEKQYEKSVKEETIKYTRQIRDLVKKIKSVDPRVKRQAKLLEEKNQRKNIELERKKAADHKKVLEQIEKYQNEDNYDPNKHIILKDFDNDDKDEESILTCTYCDRSFSDEQKFITHCKTNKHQKAVSKAKAQFIKDPHSFTHTPALYVILGLSPSEIEQYGNEKVANMPLVEEKKQATVQRGSSTQIEAKSDENSEEEENDDEKEFEGFVRKKEKKNNTKPKEQSENRGNDNKYNGKFRGKIKPKGKKQNDNDEEDWKGRRSSNRRGKSKNEKDDEENAPRRKHQKGRRNSDDDVDEEIQKEEEIQVKSRDIELDQPENEENNAEEEQNEVVVPQPQQKNNNTKKGRKGKQQKKKNQKLQVEKEEEKIETKPPEPEEPEEVEEIKEEVKEGKVEIDDEEKPEAKENLFAALMDDEPEQNEEVDNDAEEQSFEQNEKEINDEEEKKEEQVEEVEKKSKSMIPIIAISVLLILLLIGAAFWFLQFNK